MKPEDIKLIDLSRIFIGDLPPLFYLELVFRALFIYTLLIVSMRLMGKRMASQIGRTEMAAVASLAAAVGIPLMNPDRGLLTGLVMAMTIVLLQIWVARKSARNETFEKISQDRIEPLVIDGVMDLKKMKQNRITQERLFAQLRTAKQHHLGNVRALYLEANGLFSLLLHEQPKPGLPVIPANDVTFLLRHTRPTTLYACKSCGYIKQETTYQDNCPCCEANEWMVAVTDVNNNDNH